LDSAKRCGTHVAVCALKTWLGGWTTSHRMHEEVVLACLFGCPAKDEWVHYACCPALRRITAPAVGLPRAPSLIDYLALGPSPVLPRHLLALDFLLYHYAKALCMLDPALARPWAEGLARCPRPSLLSGAARRAAAIWAAIDGPALCIESGSSGHKPRGLFIGFATRTDHYDGGHLFEMHGLRSLSSCPSCGWGHGVA